MNGYIGKISDGTNTRPVASTLYGTCATGASVQAKAVSCDDFDTLISGVTIFVKFTYSNTAANPKLNVNDTGAIFIKRYGNTAPGTDAASSWNEGSVVAFTYDGIFWQMVGWMNTDTNTNTWTALKGATATAAGTAGYAPQPKAGDNTKYLKGDGTWSDITATSATNDSKSQNISSTYIKGLSASGTTITYTRGDGTTGTITTQDTNTDTNTTYSLSKSGSTITLTGSDGKTSSVSDSNTTYVSVTAASGGTATGLVTAGEKYTWNSKVSSPIKSATLSGTTLTLTLS